MDELLAKILEDVAFERSFYSALAENCEYELVYIDANSPESPKEELHRRAIEAQAALKNVKILYRISHGTYAIVHSKENPTLYGVVPENESDGWSC